MLGCDRRSRHCRLAVELENLLSVLLEALEIVDVNPPPAEMSCFDSTQLSEIQHPLESKVRSPSLLESYSARDHDYTNSLEERKASASWRSIMSTSSVANLSTSCSNSISTNRVPTEQEVATGSDLTTFHVFSHNEATNVSHKPVKSGDQPAVPIQPFHCFEALLESKSSSPLVYTSMPLCQDSFVRHVLLSGLCSEGSWWMDGFSWVNRLDVLPKQHQTQYPPAALSNGCHSQRQELYVPKAARTSRNNPGKSLALATQQNPERSATPSMRDTRVFSQHLRQENPSCGRDPLLHSQSPDTTRYLSHSLGRRLVTRSQTFSLFSSLGKEERAMSSFTEARSKTSPTVAVSVMVRGKNGCRSQNEWVKTTFEKQIVVPDCSYRTIYRKIRNNKAPKQSWLSRDLGSLVKMRCKGPFSNERKLKIGSNNYKKRRVHL